MSTNNLVRYVTHVIVGTVLFLVFCIPVIAMNPLIVYLTANSAISSVLLSALRALQFVVVTVDLLLFAQLLLRATVDLLRRA